MGQLSLAPFRGRPTVSYQWGFNATQGSIWGLYLLQRALSSQISAVAHYKPSPVSPLGGGYASVIVERDVVRWYVQAYVTRTPWSNPPLQRLMSESSSFYQRPSQHPRILPSSLQNPNQHPTTLGNWTVRSDGWVADCYSQLLFWVPRELRDAFPGPQNPLAIGHQGSIQVDYQNMLLGDRWRECYLG
jgi:hypothetical protein